MDAITLKTTVNELNNILSGKKIEKVYQPKDNELFIKIKNEMLYISIHPTLFRIHLTSVKPDNPPTPPMFTMLLRKHITKGLVESIEMDSLERVVKMNITNVDEMFNPTSFTLYFELMGKHSNIILVDKNNIIVDSIKRIPAHISSVRQVLPGLEYNMPPTKDDIGTLDNISAENIDSVTGIHYYAKQAIKDGTLLVETLIDSIKNPYPNIIYKDNKAKYGFGVKIEECKAFDTMSEMLDSFYSQKCDNTQNTDIIRNMRNLIERNKRSIKNHEKNLALDESKYKLYGELLTNYGYSIQKGQATAKVLNYYTNEEIEIPLDTRLTPNENAQKYYKKYNKVKTAKEYAVTHIEALTGQVEYLEEVVCFLTNATSYKEVEQIKQELKEQGFIKKSKVKQKIKPLSFMSYTLDNGTKILVGRNSNQNDELTTKKSRKEFVWLHTLDIPGSHVVIQDENPDDETIKIAGMIAAYHSKGRDSSNVAVDYTKIKYVKKPSHALPGKVIYTNQHTLYVTPDFELISKYKDE